MSLTTCIIGAGIIAHQHAAAIHEMKELSVTAVADVTQQKALQFASRFHMKGYTSYKEMVAKESPDLVIITLPHYLHHEAAIYCAKQGCHILLEKPMALTKKECEEINEVIANTNVKLMVAHTQHYLHENLIARTYIHEHHLGPLLAVNEIRHAPYFNKDRPRWFLEKEKAGGGIFMNLGAHSIEKIQWMTDSSFRFVKANLSFPDPSDGDVEGSGVAYMETRDGIPVTITMSGFQVAPTQRTEYIFDGGIVKTEIGKGVWVSKGENYVPLLDHSNESNPFMLQLTDMLKCINGELEGNGKKAQDVVHIVERIYESNRRNEGIWILEKGPH